jgi:hypothetical protein
MSTHYSVQKLISNNLFLSVSIKGIIKIKNIKFESKI